MLRQLPRSHKSIGLKVKHVLQITMLIGVCVWLLYQVKHTHEKRNDLYESGGRSSEKMEETEHKIFRLGRKDFGSEIHMVTDKQSEDREEEDDEEVKHEENDGDKRDSGGEEIEQHDQDRADDDTDQEEFVDGEEETQNESGKETESDDRGSSKTQGHEHGDTGLHEVESVSNGLIPDTQLIGSDLTGSELEREKEEHVKDSNEPKKNSETTSSQTTTEETAVEGSESKGNNSEVKVVPGEVEFETVNDASHNVTTSEDDVRLSEVQDESRQNLTVSDFNDQTESHNNSASENGETPVSVLHNDRNVTLSESQDQNTTITESQDQYTTSSELQEHESSLPEFQDQNRILRESHDQNIILSELQDRNTTTSTELENRNTTVTGWQGQHTTLSDSQDQNTTFSSEQKENADSVPESRATDEHSEPEVVDEAVHTDGESSSNSLAPQEERYALTDLETLPQEDSDDTETKAVAAE